MDDINAGIARASGKKQVDNVDNGPPVGLDGFQDEPLQDNATPQDRYMHSPINVGDFYVIYAPDSDGVVSPASEDDSWLGVGVNVANGDGDVFDDLNKLMSPPDLPLNIMVPFDSDGNGNPCVLGVGAGSRWAPENPVLTYDEAIESVTLAFFLCANDVGDLTGPDFQVVVQQRNQLATELIVDNLNGANVQVFPPIGSTCAQIAARGTDNNHAFPDGRGNDDVEVIVNKIDSQISALFPGADYKTDIRFRLAKLGMTLRSDASADLSNEDSMFALLTLELPEIEVKKEVRCVGEGDNAWREFVETPPSGELEFRIEVENTGNIDLAVELEDVLTGPIDPVPGSMQVTLYRPGDNPVGQNVTFVNAASFDPKLNPFFFGPSGNQFLTDMQSGTRRCLGVLKGGAACDPGVPSEPGDRVVITFQANVDDTGNFCQPGVSEIRNTILACGDPDFPSNGPCPSPSDGDEVYDRPNDIDTPRELSQDDDDNVVNANVICFESLLICDKNVSVDYGNDGSNELVNRSSVVLDSSQLPALLTYTVRVTNGGDTTIEDICVVDDGLLAAAAAAGLSVGSCDFVFDGTCAGPGSVGAQIASLAGGASTTLSCEILLETEEQFAILAVQDGGAGGDACYENTASSSGTATLDEACGDFSQSVNSAPCGAVVCLQEPPRDCLPTKAKFDIWNENEVRFSGTERCIYSWDQEWLSQYTLFGHANHFHRNALQTDKGKARIEGMRSPVVCGEQSIDAPLLGVHAMRLEFGFNGQSDPQPGIATAGTTLVGMGTEAGQIRYNLPSGPDESNMPAGFGDGQRDPLSLLTTPASASPIGGPRPHPGATTPALATIDPRVDISTKGSLLVYPKIEIKWDAAGTVIQDTFITIVNDFSDDIPLHVQLYFVNGDLATDAILEGDPPVELERAHLGCNRVDNVIILTHDESAYWSSLSGLPKGVSPFTVLDPGFPAGRPDTDPHNVGGRVLRGYLLAWAVENDTSREIRWNHMSGTGTLVNYRDTTAWTYNTWNFQALAGGTEGDLLLAPHGQLDLNGTEYEYAPDRLLFDFFAVGAYLHSGPAAIFGAEVDDTDLTLWAALKDLRDP